MIVICTNCKAKFRVADDRIGPRGARVRCSRCRTVFHVLADAAPPLGEAADLAATQIAAAPRGRGVELENPFAGGAAPSHEAPAEADPFAAAGLGVAVGPSQPPPAHPDPFASAAPAPDDPFAAHASADPFAAPPPRDFQPPPGPAPHAATDLSDLVDASSPPPIPEDARPEPSLDIPHVDAPSPEDGGLALEERSPIVPTPVAARSFDEPEPGVPPAHTADGFVLGGDPRAFESYDFGPPDAGPGLALETAAPPPEPPRPASSPPPLPTAFASAPAPIVPIAEPVHPSSRISGPIAELPAPERVPAPSRSRLRAALVNAIALAALLAVTLGILVVWRSDRPLEGFSLRPTAILAALGRGGDGSPFAAVDVRSGIYEREKGPPVLFVRGKVISRAPTAVRGVRVRVEVVRGDGVLARGEALAGAVPTAEELWQLGDGPALAGLADAAARRAPAEIRPGDAVPFLVPIADPPTDLDGASVRVELAAAGTPRR